MISKLQGSSKTAALVLAGFWGIFLAIYLIQRPVDGLMGQMINLRSEYTVFEQLTKLYLLIIILSAIFAYSILKAVTMARISIIYLLLGLTMYLSESNMITEKTQPIFAASLLLPLFYLLLVRRSWGTLLLLISGFGVISVSVLLDFVKDMGESLPFYALIPGFVLDTLTGLREEAIDAVGIGLICSSALVQFIEPLQKFAAKNIAGVFGVLGAAGLLAAGNGYLHFQYQPSVRFEFAALVITWLGFAGLVAVNKYLNIGEHRLALISENYFYTFLLGSL